jgi:hypothetical protein
VIVLDTILVEVRGREGKRSVEIASLATSCRSADALLKV